MISIYELETASATAKIAVSEPGFTPTEEPRSGRQLTTSAGADGWYT
jgi:hypothetical protein